MKVENIRFGMKLKHARLLKRMRLKDVADKIGCSESMLSKIENDKVTPSIGMLHRLVSALETNIGTLLDPSDEGSHITRRGGRPVIQRASSNNDAGIYLEWLTPFPIPNLFQSSIHIIEPGAHSDGEVVHEGEDFGYVLEGTLQLSIDGQVETLNQGDTFSFPSRLPHSYSNPSDLTTRVLWFNTPPTF